MVTESEALSKTQETEDEPWTKQSSFQLCLNQNTSRWKVSLRCLMNKCSSGECLWWTNPRKCPGRECPWGPWQSNLRSCRLQNNAQIPIPLLYPCPTEPQTLLRLIVHLQQHLHFLLEELWKTTPCLPEGIEKRTFLKENYECCLTQLHLYVKIRLLKDLDEIAKLPKCPEYQTNKAKSETRSEESELGHNAVQEYLMKL